MAMTKQTRSLLSTFLVGAVGATVMWLGYFSTRAQNEAEHEATQAQARAFAFAPENARKVVLARTGEDPITMERVDGRWHLTSPLQTRADEFTVESLVKTVSDWKAKDLNAETKPRKAPDFALADASRAADFGLDEPALVVSLTLADETAHTLKLAAPNPYDQSRPFLVEGRPSLALAAGGQEAPLEKSVFDLRDKSVAVFQTAEIHTLEARSDAGAWSVEQQDGAWALTAPFEDAADKDTIEGMLGKVRSAHAKSFVDGDGAKDLNAHGLAVPALTLVMQSGTDLSPQTLEFGKSTVDGTPRLYVRRNGEGPLMELENEFLDGVLKTAEDVRDRRVIPFDRAKVAKLEVASGEERFTVLRESVDGEEHFALEGEDERKLKAWKLTSALHVLSTLKGQKLVEDQAVELARWGLDAPAKTFVVTGEDGELARLLVGKDAGDDRVYAMRAGSGRVYEVERSTIASLPSSVSDVLEEVAQAGIPTEE